MFADPDQLRFLRARKFDVALAEVMYVDPLPNDTDIAVKGEVLTCTQVR